MITTNITYRPEGNVCMMAFLCVYMCFCFAVFVMCDHWLLYLPECGRETFSDDPFAVSPSLRLIPIQPPISNYEIDLMSPSPLNIYINKHTMSSTMWTKQPHKHGQNRSDPVHRLLMCCCSFFFCLFGFLLIFVIIFPLDIIILCLTYRWFLFLVLILSIEAICYLICVSVFQPLTFISLFRFSLDFMTRLLLLLL